METPDIHILIVGTGAVGAFYGSRLHRPGDRVYVSFTCRSNYQAVKRNGIELETRSFANYRIIPHRTFPSIDQAATQGPGGAKSWDFVILCTKVLPGQVDDAMLISPLLIDQHPPPTLVLIQNGIGFEDHHRLRFPTVPLLSAVTVVNAEQIKPGLIRQNQWTRISIGPYVDFSYAEKPPSRKPPTIDLEKICNTRMDLLVKLFKLGGIRDAETYSQVDLQILRWHKLAINASMNPSSILSGGMSSPEMVACAELREHLTGCMEEVFEAAKIIFKMQKFPSHFATIEQILESTEKAGARSAIKPSMLIDWENHRPLELEAILGIPIRIAARHGVKLNRIHSMYAFLSNLQLARYSNKAHSNQPKL